MEELAGEARSTRGLVVDVDHRVIGGRARIAEGLVTRDREDVAADQLVARALGERVVGEVGPGFGCDRPADVDRRPEVLHDRRVVFVAYHELLADHDARGCLLRAVGVRGPFHRHARARRLVEVHIVLAVHAATYARDRTRVDTL